MELVLLIALIDPSRTGEFMPTHQYYQYVTPLQCESTQNYTRDDPYRMTLCLKSEELAGLRLTVDELIARAQS